MIESIDINVVSTGVFFIQLFLVIFTAHVHSEVNKGRKKMTRRLKNLIDTSLVQGLLNIYIVLVLSPLP